MTGVAGDGRIAPMALSDRDRAILDLERTWWTQAGSKEAAIRSRLSMSPTSYYKALGELLESDEAMVYDPLVVRRVRRLRDRRRRQRFEGPSAGERPSR